jgi:hypothetical protein
LLDLSPDDTLITLHNDSSLTANLIDRNGITSFEKLWTRSAGSPDVQDPGGEDLLFPLPSDQFPKTLLYALIHSPYDPRGDNIAIFDIVSVLGDAPPGVPPETTMMPAKIYQVPTGLSWTKGMAFSKDGRFLIVGSLKGGVKVFRREGDGTNLTQVANNSEAPTRTSFVWLN